jgi:hypothetical protein
MESTHQSIAKFDAFLMTRQSVDCSFIFENGKELPEDYLLAAAIWHCPEERDSDLFRIQYEKVNRMIHRTTFTAFVNAYLEDLSSPDLYKFHEALGECILLDKEHQNMYALYEFDGTTSMILPGYNNEYLKKILEYNPDFLFAKEELATCLDPITECEKQIAYYHDVQRYYSNDQLSLRICEALLNCRRLDDFVRSMNALKHLEINSTYLQLLSRYNFEFAGNFELAIDYAEKAIVLDSLNLSNHVTKVLALTFSSEKDQALNAVGHVLSNQLLKDQNQEFLLILTSIIYLKFNEVSKAEMVLTELRDLDSSPSMIRFLELIMEKRRNSQNSVYKSEIESLWQFGDVGNTIELLRLCEIANFQVVR